MMTMEEDVLILRECIYALQGINGERIRFWENKDDNDNTGRFTNTYEGIRIRPSCREHVLSSSSERGGLDPKSLLLPLGSGSIDAIRICCEAGWLYKRIQFYIDKNMRDDFDKNDDDDNKQQQEPEPEHRQSGARGGGVVSRALAVALSNDLHHYQKLVAVFESKLQQQQQLQQGVVSSDMITLRQLLVRIRLPIYRLKTLAMLTDGLASYQGGQLLNELYKHTIHGDTRHSILTKSILSSASKPWFDLLYAWTMKGMIINNEFFIIEKESADDENDDDDDNDKYMWYDRYKINYNQIPYGIFDKELVTPSLIVGKGINFIRKCLLDTNWILDLDDGNNNNNNGNNIIDNNNLTATSSIDDMKKVQLGYYYHDTTSNSNENTSAGHYLGHASPLHQTLANAAHQVHRYILTSLRDDHHIIDHLWALKQFLLLGQGDFVTALMDGLYAEYDDNNNDNNNNGTTSSSIFVGNFNVINKHTLSSILDSALKSTNAISLPTYCLDKLHVELDKDDDNDDSQYKFGPGFNIQQKKKSTTVDDEIKKNKKTVWDRFMLTYDISTPLAAIVHPHAMNQYKLVFKSLFQLKHTEYMLNTTWRQSKALQHALQISALHLGINTNISSSSSAQRHQSKKSNSSNTTSSSTSTNHYYTSASLLLRKISTTRQSMIHFVNNLQSYLMFEVLEGGWKNLIDTIKVARTLDDIIYAHDNYLEDIVRKSLLQDNSNANEAEENDEATDDTHEEEPKCLATQLSHLLKVVRTFCTLQRRIFTDAQREVDKARQRRREAERRLNEGQWGFETEGDVPEEEHFYGLTNKESLDEVLSVSEDFNDNIVQLLRLLHEKWKDGNNDSSTLGSSQQQQQRQSSVLSGRTPISTPSSSSSSNSNKHSRGRRGSFSEAMHDYIGYRSGIGGSSTGDQFDESLGFLTFRLDYSDYYSKLGAVLPQQKHY